MSYAGSPYLFGQNGSLRFLDGAAGIDHWNGNNNSSRYYSDYGGWNGLYWEIGEDTPAMNVITDPLPFNDVKPGDIVKFFDTTGRDAHTAIICKVERSDSSALHRSDITVIESASGARFTTNFQRYSTMKETWEEYKRALPAWTFKVYRLRISQ